MADNETRYCISCGQARDPGSTWCCACHALVLLRLYRRFPAGGQDDDPPAVTPPRARRNRPRPACGHAPYGRACCTCCGLLGPVCGHIRGQPWCYDCLSPRRVPPGRPARPDDDGGPWQQMAVRALEDALSWREDP